MNEIMKTVMTELTIDAGLAKSFDGLFKETFQLMRRQGLSLSPERWLSLSNHLLGVLQRVNTAEELPPVDQVVIDQISPDMMTLSRQVLATVESGGALPDNITEVVLLAVHFEVAKACQ